ncbi:MAG: transposase, partial [Candidatus Magnetobacterium sp. LHC-1]
IEEYERTEVVVKLTEVIHYQAEVIQSLKDEIAVLKGNKPRPDIKPGKMEKGTTDKKSSSVDNLGSQKKSKTVECKIDETIMP